MRRARNSRDLTVPTGTSSTRAISSYDSPSTSLNTTVSRNCSGSWSIARSTSSSTMRSKKVPWGSSSWSSSNTEKGSIASRSTVSGWRVRLRYSLRKACGRMVSSHPCAVVPFWYCSHARYAFSIVSSTTSCAGVHSTLRLAVLEAVKNPGPPGEDGLSEFAEELLSKRLGLSPTVAMQLREYEAMVRRDAAADPAHVEALLRLVGRRPDADL